VKGHGDRSDSLGGPQGVAANPGPADAPAGETADPIALTEQDVRLMATVLVGAWRRSPPPMVMPAEALGRATVGLLRSKTGALGWWRVRNSPLAGSVPGERLRQAYHRHGLQAALHGRSLTRVVTRLRSGGIEPVLMKGPAIARLYAERGLRPFDDLDLCVHPDQYHRALALLRGWTKGLSSVDLHRGFARLYARSWGEMFSRSQLVTLAGTPVRVLSPEDHLRVLCLHQLKHGTPSPLWLCDVAVALESRSADFDWSHALGPDRKRADWVACTIGLAHQILEVPIDDTPVATRATRLPAWLVPSVLRQWARHATADYQGPHRFAPAWRFLSEAPGISRHYWPSPVAASIHLRAPFSDLPRLPIQAVDAAGRMIRFCVRRMLGYRPDGELM
jgi:Uncharacterised nucleotidyltransferase